MSKNVLQQCPKIFCNFVQKVLAKNIGGVVFYEQRRKSRTLVRTDPGIPIQRADMQGLVHRASDTGLDNDILDPKTEKREKYICIRGG